MKKLSEPFKSKFKCVEIDALLEKMVYVTYAELVALRDEAKLIAGQMYRMTDYETTCSWINTQCAGHPFDLVLTALDNKTLDEKCSAIWSERDTDGYFANSNLPAWDVRYCLDNDMDRFDWAVKGGCVIGISAFGTTFSSAPIGNFVIDGVNYNAWDALYEGEPVFGILSEKATPSVGDTVYLTMDGETIEDTATVISSTMTKDGKGVIYRLVDESRNDIPYDFKNIMFSRPLTDGRYDEENGTDTFCYTFCCIDCDTFEIADHSVKEPFYCIGNTMREYAIDNVFLTFSGSECYSNTFGNYCNSNTFGDYCYSNTFGVNCYDNTFGVNCYNNTFGDSCSDNSFGDSCGRNTFGGNCYNNTFGVNCYSNTFGDSCTHNELRKEVNFCTLGTGSTVCHFDNYANNHTIGIRCHGNYFGAYTGNNTIGNDCRFNAFEAYADYNTLGKNCSHNKFGTYSQHNSFGNYCSSNVLDKSSSYNKLGESDVDFYASDIVFSSCSNVVVTTTDTGTMSNYLEKYHFSSLSSKNISATRKRTYDTYVTTDKNGNVVEYTIDDIINK